jgi:hypothetical protein
MRFRLYYPPPFSPLRICPVNTLKSTCSGVEFQQGLVLSPLTFLLYGVQRSSVIHLNSIDRVEFLMLCKLKFDNELRKHREVRNSKMRLSSMPKVLKRTNELSLGIHFCTRNEIATRNLRWVKIGRLHASEQHE